MVPRSVRWPLLGAVLWLLLAGAAAGQHTSLTVEDIYSYEGWRRFNGSRAATMTWAPNGDPWLSDTHHLWPLDSGEDRPAPSEAAAQVEGPWLKVEATTGATEPLFTYAHVGRALIDAGVAPAAARNASRTRPTIFSTKRDAFLVSIGDDLYVYDISTRRASRVTASAGTKSE